MLISYEPNSDVLSITLQAVPVAQSQVQGNITVGFDAVGQAVSVSIPEASSLLWERGGQINVILPQPAPTVVEKTTTTIVEQT